MTRPVGLQVGQGQAGDRLVAERVEPLAEAASARGRSSAAWVRASRLSNRCPTCAAEPPGAGLGVQRLEELLAASRVSRAWIRMLVRTACWFLVAVDQGRDGRDDGQDRRQRPPRRCWPRPARGSACTTARTAGRTGSAASGSAGSRRTAAARRPAPRPSRTGRSGPWPAP